MLQNTSQFDWFFALPHGTVRLHDHLGRITGGHSCNFLHFAIDDKSVLAAAIRKESGLKCRPIDLAREAYLTAPAPPFLKIYWDVNDSPVERASAHKRRTKFHWCYIRHGVRL